MSDFGFPLSDNDGMGLPDLSAMGGVLPENYAAIQNNNGVTNIVNVSTDYVEPTTPFDSASYEAQCRAQAGTAEHLKFMTIQPGNSEQLQATTTEFTRMASTLMQVQLPDTRVIIAGQKMEISSRTKQYANDLNHGIYIQAASQLYGKAKMTKIFMCCKKANMAHTPALWLNTAIEIEAQKNDVYTIGVNEYIMVSLREMEAKITPEIRLQSETMLKSLLGRDLYGRVERLANTTRVSVYVMVVALVDRILKRECKITTQAPSTIWDGATLEGKEETRQEMTAKYAERFV